MACFFGSDRGGCPTSLKKMRADDVRRTCLQQKDEQHYEKLQRLLHGHNWLSSAWLQVFGGLLREKKRVERRGWVVGACLQRQSYSMVFVT